MPELITAIATLLWPLLMLMVLLVFRRAIGRVLHTAEKRELEFDIGGQRLTLHELNDQQNEMIQDLQRQLSTVSKKLDERERALAETAEPPAAGRESHETHEHAEQAPPESAEVDAELPPVQAPTGSEPFAVLWVADRPENHALLVGQLRDNGVRVTAASTTAEAIAEVAERPYRLIVSDMARREEDRHHVDAGLSLLRELRDLGVDTPVIVFSGQRGQLQYGGQARQLGAVATTSSTYEMFRHFQNFDLL
ncbi:response regulator [Haloactinomyces albus]|uniref:CheY-like chemotaxis protein/uncharacterized coiled-coil protein SlyX n=1 Tax=Haloactinomyces albus TaxID=1352928 RepID=A0AAE4CNU4_9ACTN|nr:response regulator [Haloactinomyces albus]MDR7301033.1 CheY-like chemotaxis protein/uncharacterized coiled-coil protein SlyX [Haloactinomyces albus]